MHREPKLARRLFGSLRARARRDVLRAGGTRGVGRVGLQGLLDGLFRPRSAPLGEVAPEVVTAIFYNFAPTRVAKALPAAWQIAGPEEALRVRLDTAVEVLRRYGLEADENVSTAAELLRGS